MFLRRWLSRRQFLFLFIMLPILPFGSRSLICRSDPIIGLSNGQTLIVGANIEGRLQDIKQVHYEVHVPKGLTMTSYESTPLWEKTQETFDFLPDQKPGQYKVIVTLTLSDGADDLVADVRLLNANGTTLKYLTEEGDSRERITIRFRG